MKTSELIAIDVHTHAEVSCRQPADDVWQEFEDAASKYFKAGKRPTMSIDPHKGRFGVREAKRLIEQGLSRSTSTTWRPTFPK